MPTAQRLSAIDTGIAPATIERFAADLRRVWQAGVELPLPFGVAVSGGPDSLALLLLAHALRPDHVEAATVDHGLRPESAGEAAHVARICAELGVAHSTISVTVAEGNMHEAARKARYAALGAWAAERGLVAVATAHHADDQAETLLMRLNRASGLRGLSAIRAVNAIPSTETLIVRPLLAWTKVELQRIVTEAEIAAAVDPSNTDLRFDRARVRAGLASADWLDAEGIARSAGHLAQAEQALGWAVEREWREQVTESGDGLVYRPIDAPEAIRLRIFERMIAINGGTLPRGGELAALSERLRGGGKATLGGAIVEVVRGTWKVRPEGPRR